MKLAFYIGTRSPWYIGLGNRLVRLRLRSQISHCELLFEPGDGVDDLMPLDSIVETAQASAAPDASGAMWCASASASDVMPAWSPRRAGRRGGVRFKRINFGADHWRLINLPQADARRAAHWFSWHQGALYDWQGIFGFIAWPVPDKAGRWACHEACAAALGLPDPHRFDPASLAAVASWAAGLPPETQTAPC